MDKKEKKAFIEDSVKTAGAQIGNRLSRNVQNGSDTMHIGMKLLTDKAHGLNNVGYEQAKGNLFEYIEAAKLQTNMANNGAMPFDRSPVTDLSKSAGGYGEHTAPDDFRMAKGGDFIGRGQAKFNNDPHKATLNLVNKKYAGQQRVVPIDQVTSVKVNLEVMSAKGEISQKQYSDARNNLQEKGLTDPDSGISSGGTSTKEMEQFRGKEGKLSQAKVNKYAKNLKHTQYGKEIGTSAQNGAVAQAACAGIVSGVQNLWDVYKDRKKLDQALRDIGADTGKAAARGGAMGTLLAILRIGGKEKTIPVLKSNTAAVVAGSVIDVGVAVYGYARGEIDGEQLKAAMQDTIIKATATIYYTAAIEAVSAATSVLIPIAVYSAASYFVTCTRSIMRQAKLNALEYDRLAALNNEATAGINEYRRKMERCIAQLVDNQRQLFQNFLIDFDRNLEAGNFKQGAVAMVGFAKNMGIELQYANFSDFDKAMNSSDDFVLK